MQICKPGDKKKKDLEVDEDDLELTPRDDDVPVIGKGKQSMYPIEWKRFKEIT